MKTILLDSNALIWFLQGNERLSTKCRELIANPENLLFVSAASTWELTIKANAGKISLGEPPDAYFRRHLAEQSFQRLGILHEHVYRVAQLPPHHKDPFDRMLAAQALVEGVPILSSDRIFERYGCEWISAV